MAANIERPVNDSDADRDVAHSGGPETVVLTVTAAMAPSRFSLKTGLCGLRGAARLHAMRRILLLGAVSALCVYAVAATFYAVRARDSAIRGWHAAKEAGTEKAFRESLRLNAGIASSTPDREIVDKLTNLLYQHANFGGEFRNTPNNALRYVWNMHGANREYCSTLSATLVWALRLFDIQARVINIAADSFLNGEQLGDTHTLVEVKVGDSIYLTDPTFDTHYYCGEGTKEINAKKMNECVRSNRKLRWTYIGQPRDGRRLSDYYLSIDKLAVNMDADDAPHEFYTYEYPRPNWLEDARRQYDKPS